MRFFSIVTAVLVTLALYLIVFERDGLLSFASNGEEPVAVQDTDPDTSETSEAETEDGARVVSVVALKSTAQGVDNAVVLRGRTEAARQVDVRAETSGLVKSEPLRKGSSVEAGQLLCEIAPGTRETALREAEARLPEAKARLPEAEGRVLEAEARLKEAQINDNAAKQLSEGGFASEVRVAGTQAAVQSALAAVETARAGVESARAGILAAEAAIAAARNEIGRLQIKAPFAGLLETDTAELGALMQPGGLCATVIQLNPIKLVSFVPETDVAKVELGARAGGRTTAGQTVEGKVTFISRSSDPETRTFRVEITVNNNDLALRDGQTAEIIIGAEGQKAHLVPASALTLNDEGALGVQLAADDKAAFTPVTILRDTTNGIWVTGLPEQAAIIIVGQEYVTDGVAINVTYSEGKS
ncbi:efflux RND transporter periplasmic adaptor subunit [Litoreibacter arenae]|uniref:Putative Co/Zn/Cd efflux system membrane fusion protein n=1 Tax=Litoreibacter arenae DSM 19593 TaxID=1123360 RepID=S9RZ41_9RHOB|nr:efflux RND transporter periplasmic adaptor subunit [Litoreibacter arenae]EPX79244.1 putative Co/Zn/Cd efflux system membrane fusion protein [Litoreibacter arenae DSM 19593]